MSNRIFAEKKKLIPVAIALSAMLGVASFAIVPNTGQPTVDELGKKAILLGDTNSDGIGFTTNRVMWQENCIITDTSGSPSFSISLKQCTKHTIVLKLVGVKGARDTFAIENLQCLASTQPTLALIRGHVDSGVLVDINERSGQVDHIKLTDRPNEWVVTMNHCNVDPTNSGSRNALYFDVVLVKDGIFEFDFSVEAI